MDKLISQILTNGYFKDSPLDIVLCIIKYFNVEDDYPKLKSYQVNQDTYNSLIPIFKSYGDKTKVNVKLTNELKKKLNDFSQDEIYDYLRKFMANYLTNKEIIRYIKEIIDKKDLYHYEKYSNMSKKEKVKEINNITKIFEILDTFPFQTNEIGILYKHIIFDIDSDEYKNLSPSLYFDIYDISYYKRVLERLKASF